MALAVHALKWMACLISAPNPRLKGLPPLWERSRGQDVLSRLLLLTSVYAALNFSRSLTVDRQESNAALDIVLRASVYVFL